MAQELTDFLARYTDRQFQWGADDCSLFLADWWAYRHGVDPAAHLRGAYATEAEKAEIVRQAGSLVLLVEDLAERVGAKVRTGPAQPGDFAVIAPGVGAIFTGGYWVARGEAGLSFVSKAKVWRKWCADPK